MLSKRKKMTQEKRKKTRGKRKVKSGDCCVTVKPKPSKFCYLCILKLGKLILLLEKIRRPQSVQPINGILGSFGSVWPDSDWISF